MQQYFEDGIKRDGLLWVGDARIQALCNYTLFGDLEIVKKSLKFFAMNQGKEGKIYANAINAGAHQHPENIAYMFDFIGNTSKSSYPNFYNDCGEIFLLSYATDFISMIWEYYIYSGDINLIQDLWEFAVRDAHYIFDEVKYADKSILLQPNSNILNGRYIDSINYSSSYYADALCAINNYKKLAIVMTDTEEIQKSDKWLDFYTCLLNKEFSTKDGMLFALEQDGKKVFPHSLQSFALLSGFMDKYTAKQNYIKMQKKSNVAFPLDGMTEYWSLRGLFEAGLYEDALNEIKNYWGYMLSKNATTCWEKVDYKYPENIDDSNILSHCHGWSAGPADLFARYLLGIQSNDGYKSITLNPKLCGLDFAEGILPTIHGDIKILIDKKGIETDLPKGISIL
jgi:hypothetical protein